VIWCSPTNDQPKLKLLRKKWGQFIDGLNEADIEKIIQQGQTANLLNVTLCVLDDLMLQTAKTHNLNKLFISGRHRNVTVMELRQTIFGSRLARVQQECFVLGRNGTQKDEATRLFQQIAIRERECWPWHTSVLQSDLRPAFLSLTQNQPRVKV
jgi:hypothetical protein